ncbi:AAA family ATPase [Candidatus Electronema sp. PJ]|uniref:AAA family ATPase n=1 Tax=Candidatus Electronema sp. PJ TaxID=3401572 RepID=UPI003AA973CB
MNSSQQNLRKIRVEQRLKLERYQAWEESFHVFDEESALAVEMALAAGRPLLVRGEPGSGKSQLARAAAQELNRTFIAEVITATTDGQDLLWHYDPVARLYDAQTLAAEAAARAYQQELEEEEANLLLEDEQQSASPPVLQTDAASRKKNARYRKKKVLQQKRQHLFKAIGLSIAQQNGLPGKTSEELQPSNYISPGPLWWALDWVSALRQHERCRCPFYHPPCFTLNRSEETTGRGTVLLLDEIDKAEPSLPNALLEVLGNGGFQVPLLNQTIMAQPSNPRPLVIITTNEERELPPAFIRRCLVLNLRLDDEQRLRTWWSRQINRTEPFNQERALVKWLAERGEVHFENIFAVRIREKAAELLVRDRREAKQAGLIKPGQAEYLDMLRALQVMTEPGSNEQQLALLERISSYALIKYPQE